MFLRLLRTVFSQVSLRKANSQNAELMAIGRIDLLEIRNRFILNLTINIL